ncbi:hypothetical protein CK503_05635 [Aliifodinibius salipaludis]|uniref:Bacterial surface antigen (D15) domain-containing protein n=1 Tax=Fodinibius salipaludis TaxID=2032627 RepID=A0A2A2GDK2_9BACT|nr:DUF5686 and carboxypeptidase-like regulatory domain-containing protein [Aliifodinibius salipaludis]PAU94949.1 hypothetical protein CK503_05635 [Aliifodinibius salipaludis]
MLVTRTFVPVLFFLLFICSSLQAQKTISGTVTDAQTQETLPSANILIKDTYHGTITNSNGNFSLTIPDSLLPATLLIRYIGYETQQLTITKSSSAKQNISLKPSVTEMQEIVVTDEDPGMRIMREVIKRKQQWRKQLKTYRAEAYTRQSLSNDTAIVSISESVSEVFWDKEKGHREVQKSKRQTANIEASANFAGVSYLPNFYDDDIEIAKFELVGITHPDAPDYYDFKLVDQTSLDNQTVYEIKVTPAKKLQPLFEGTAYVLADEYALIEVDLAPNDVVNFPPPIKSFSTSYQQQFNNFGQDFWLPVDVRIGGDIKIKMVGLDFPTIKFKQLSRITNYQVNTSMPDSLYKNGNQFSVDSTTVQSDSLIAQQVNTVPLSSEEEQAYATLDSTATLEKAFKPSGFLAKFIDEEDEDYQSDSGSLNFLDNVPGNFTPNGWYNRVDQAFLGLRYDIDATDWLTLRGQGGYSTGYHKWNYGGGLTIEWLERDWGSATIGGDYRAGTETRYHSHIYNSYYTIIPNLLGNQGYFDYYRSEGVRFFTGWDLPQNLSFEMGVNLQNHTSLPTTTAYDILGKSNNFRPNPPIPEGTLKSIDVTTGYNVDEGYNFGATAQKKVQFTVEHSSMALGSNYEFTRYTGFISWSLPTFYQRRFLANTLDFNIKGGTYSGSLPPQKWGIVDGAIGYTAPYGVMKTIRNRPYQGQQYLSINAEHNFRTIPFELIGLQALTDRNISFIIFGGMAKTWLHNDNFLSQSGYQPKQTRGTHWEVGASFNGVLGLFRIDLATRIDQPAILLNISVARLF